MAYAILFVFGLCVGSFLNVVALRYDGEHFVFNPKVIGGSKGSNGRSHCPYCGKMLYWYELIPVASFILQRARCRGCHARIGWQYPIVELLTGAIFVAVPWHLGGMKVVAGLWIIVFLILLLISYIDIRLGIIPDELEVMLGVVALAILILSSLYLPLLLSAIIAAFAAFAFFEFLVLVTRGRGMGMGDVKLALPLGFLLGWPNIVVAVMAAFIIGAGFGVTSIALGKNKMGGTVPFGPFLAVGATFVFFFGPAMIQWYLRLAGFGG